MILCIHLVFQFSGHLFALWQELSDGSGKSCWFSRWSAFSCCEDWSDIFWDPYMSETRHDFLYFSGLIFKPYQDGSFSNWPLFLGCGCTSSTQSVGFQPRGWSVLQRLCTLAEEPRWLVEAYFTCFVSSVPDLFSHAWNQL